MIFLSSLTAYYEYLVDVLCKVSLRFKRLATDETLWALAPPSYGSSCGAVIGARGDPGRAEFVVQECLNSKTKGLTLVGGLHELYPVLSSPRFAQHINPTTRFPNWKLSVPKGDQYFTANSLHWANNEEREA